MTTFFQLLGWASGISIVVSGVFSWLFKIGVEKAIDRSLQRDFESYKATLSRDSAHQLERLKFELQSKAQEQLERLRSELNARNEVARAEIQKQMIRAQLTTTKSHEVYAQLLKLLRVAEGAVGRLWEPGSVPTFDGYSIRDFRAVLTEAKAPGEEKKQILNLLRTDRSAGLSRFQKFLRHKEEHDARGAIAAAENYILLEALFISVPVRDLAFQICATIGKAVTASHVGSQSPGLSYFETYERNLGEAAKELRQIEELMRTDLHPILVRPSLLTRETPPLHLEDGHNPEPALAVTTSGKSNG